MVNEIKIKITKNKGRGVFATAEQHSGQIIEICPIIKFTPSEYKLLEKTILDNYMYDWFGESCIPLGYGLLYNHSFTPNAKFIFHKKTQTISYIALKNIKPGTEILINYNHDPSDQTPLDMQDIHYGGFLIVKK